jgi:predicted aspartyl protease
MKANRMLWCGLVAVLSLVVSASADTNLVDPYEVLNNYFNASGGLDRLMAERTSYVEATLEVAGLTGTLKAWTQKPDKNWAEVDLKVLKITQGDNGQYGWTVDSNGKLQKATKEDDVAIRRREIARRLSEMEHADPSSDVFTVSLEGMEHINEIECYVLKVSNSINDDYITYFVNAESFLLEKSVSNVGENSADSYFKDYREVDGLTVPFWTREVTHQTGQEQIVTITQYVSNPEVDSTVFEPPEEGGKDFEFTNGDSSKDIPFEFIGRHLYIPVLAGGKERLWILDTGAGMSVILRDLAEEMGLEISGDMKGSGAGGTVDVSFAELPGYSIQGIKFQPQTVAVIEMDELLGLLGVDVGGILGFDFLSRFVTKVDYANELVSFYDPETFEYDGEGHEVDLHMESSVFEVSATLDGEHSGTWLFDLGASSVSVNGVYALREGLTKRKGYLGMGHGAANAYQTKTVPCDSIQFAGYTLYDQRFTFRTGATDASAIVDRIGTLGNTLFRHFVLYCDYANERIIVEKGDKFAQEWPQDRSGLGLMGTSDQTIEVYYVSPDTPADKAGFETGDLLYSVNGIGVEHLGGMIAIRDMLKAEAGTEYSVVVDRNGGQKELKLKLEDLL